MVLAVLKWLMLAVTPIAVFLTGAKIMNTVTHREDVTAQLRKADVPDKPAPLNQRWGGYSKADIEQFWSALAKAGRDVNRDLLGIERKFLEIDLIFPFVYVGTFAACLLLAWAMLGRPFNVAWIMALAVITAGADWTENLAQLELLRRFPAPGLDGALTQIASWATIVKLYGGVVMFLLLLVLAGFGIKETLQE